MIRTASRIASILALAFGLGLMPAWAGPTLDKVKQAGTDRLRRQYRARRVRPAGQPGPLFRASTSISAGRSSAAVFGDPDKVKYVPLTAQQRFTALQSGEVDILSSNTTDTLQRDTELGLNFAPVVFYDGQGFMVPKKLGVKSAKELNGATICVQPGTTTELNLADYFRANKMEFKPVVIEKLDEVVAAYLLRALRRLSRPTARGWPRSAPGARQNPDDHVILPERISKEPLAPVVRQGDEQWSDIVRWVVYALIEAEEKGITPKNVDEMAKSEDPDIKRMLGATPGMGKALGLDEKWAYNAIKAVGNYGEIFDRNVGDRLAAEAGSRPQQSVDAAAG